MTRVPDSDVCTVLCCQVIQATWTNDAMAEGMAVALWQPLVGQGQAGSGTSLVSIRSLNRLQCAFLLSCTLKNHSFLL